MGNLVFFTQLSLSMHRRKTMANNAGREGESERKGGGERTHLARFYIGLVQFAKFFGFCYCSNFVCM